MIFIQHYDSPLGGILLAADETGLTGLWFDGQKFFAHDLPAGRVEQNTPALSEVKRWLDIYFSGRDPGFTPPLAMEQMTEFRRQVCEIMLDIPFGETMTYGQIAKRVAQMRGLESMSSQAVGGAVGHNPVSLIIPCHRVVGMNGSLTGYAGGVEKKTALLRLEGADMSGFFIPKKGTAL